MVLGFFGASIVALAIIVGAPLSVHAAPVITEYPAGPGSDPFDIAQGPDGNMWFTQPNANTISRMTSSGAVTHFTLPQVNSYPYSVTTGTDGNVWFTEYLGDRIGFITPSGVITEYTIPTSGAGPTDIVIAPDGTAWFTEYNVGKIGKRAPDGTITEYALASPTSAPLGLALAADGGVWFTEYFGNQIGHSTPAGVITEYPVPTANSGPTGIAVGPNGMIWFTEYLGDKVGSITTAGVITEYSLPATGLLVSDITQGADGNMWFAQNGVSKLGMITPTGIVSEYNLPTAGAYPTDITAGPGGTIWFTEAIGAIGTLTVPLTPPLPSKALVTPENTAISFSPLADVTAHNYDPATLSIIAQPLHGTLTLDVVSGMIIYTPATGYVGSDAYTYQLCSRADPTRCTTGSVTVTITQASIPVTPGAPDAGVSSHYDMRLSILGMMSICVGAIYILITLHSGKSPESTVE